MQVCMVASSAISEFSMPPQVPASRTDGVLDPWDFTGWDSCARPPFLHITLWAVGVLSARHYGEHSRSTPLPLLVSARFV